MKLQYLDVLLIQEYLAYPSRFSLLRKVLIRYWELLEPHYEYQALSMTSYLPCDKWVSIFRSPWILRANKCADMSVEGIFRKNGNIRHLNELREAIDRDPSSVDLTQDNPVQLAALLKKFLRDLPEPLMTFKLHRLLIASQCELQKFLSPE
jgi:hypothetical protein